MKECSNKFITVNIASDIYCDKTINEGPQGPATQDNDKILTHIFPLQTYYYAMDVQHVLVSVETNVPS